jgi:hypothetical protein
MRFGEALELCRQGKRIHRTGWNGKNQFVYWQKGSTVAVQDIRCDAIKEWAKWNCLIGIEIMDNFDIKTTALTHRVIVDGSREKFRQTADVKVWRSWND